MKYINDLESGSSPKIAKAAQNIIKKQLHGYCPYLLDALIDEIKKSKAWKSQCQLIKAIGITNCTDSLPLLKTLINNDYEHTVLYRELAFAIFILENYSEINLDFLFDSIKKGNDLQISGACAGILYKEIIPSKNDITKIIAGISPHTEGEGKKLTPRCYIAAVAYLWPKEETRAFLEACKKSESKALVEIASDALQGKKSRMILI